MPRNQDHDPEAHTPGSLDEEGYLPANTPPPWGTESREERLKRLNRAARELPPVPGGYLMKDHKGVVLYVGKASKLPDRVSSYFVPSADLGAKKAPMLDVVHDFETITCETEWEALLTEHRLIKDNKPKFWRLLYSFLFRLQVERHHNGKLHRNALQEEKKTSIQNRVVQAKALPAGPTQKTIFSVTEKSS